MKAAWVGCLLMMSCATAQTTAQRLADLDRVAGSRIEEDEDRKRALKKEQAEVGGAWLSEELTAIGPDTSDAALHQTLLILDEAKRRELPNLVERAETARGRIVTSREQELAALVSDGRWLAALERTAAWTKDAPTGSAADAVRTRVQHLVKEAIDTSIGTASSPAEQFLLQRMKSWLGQPVSSGLEFDAMRTLVSRTPEVSFPNSGCSPAQNVTLERKENGTPLSVAISLGSCEVSMRETRGVPRTGSYNVQVERERDEQYTVQEERTVMVPVSSQNCRQETIYLGSGREKTSHIVSKCYTTTSQVAQTQMVDVTKVRRVKYTDSESRSESFSVNQRQYAVSLPVSITVTGDGVSVTTSSRASEDYLDEEYSRVHGSSRSFLSGVPLSLQGKLSGSVTRSASEAVAEWNRKRAAARMAAAKDAAPSEARRLALEAVAIDSSLAEAAVPLVKMNVSAPQLVALLSGVPSVTPLEITGGKGLALPPPSAALEEQYARLEERHKSISQTGNSDVLIGLGVGLQPTPDQKASGAFALEFQYGYVPTFSAVSHFLFRIETDFQIFLSKFLVGDASVRPEVGVRFGPFSLSAVGAAGGRLAHQQTVVDEEEDGRFSAIGYLGYGPHLSIKLGPVLLDAMALRLHAAGAPSPLATRFDGLLGVGLDDTVFLFARLRYIAYADFLAPQQVLQTADRFASITLGIMIQF